MRRGVSAKFLVCHFVPTTIKNKYRKYLESRLIGLFKKKLLFSSLLSILKGHLAAPRTHASRTRTPLARKLQPFKQPQLKPQTNHSAPDDPTKPAPVTDPKSSKKPGFDP